MGLPLLVGTVCWPSLLSINALMPKAFVANFERFVDEGWYLNSGTTHHLTNNMTNMHVQGDFNGLDQLIIGNGQVLPITHINDACFNNKGSNVAYNHKHIALKEILSVLYYK